MTLTASSLVGASPGPGISETLAKARSAAIHDLRYQLSFAIPAKKQEAIRGSETISFTLREAGEVALDFEQPKERILSASLPYTFADGHLLFAGRKGTNEIHIEFLAGDEALNRNDHYLYTLFVPARAHRTFPCFDQPDLKARYTLKMTYPKGWTAVANGPALASPGATAAGAPDADSVAFAETKPLPTYLFAFAAGKFKIETAERAGRTMRMFHRETDDAKVARNRDAIFDLHAKALAWLEDYTQIKYPWDKLDFVMVPAFQFGGMEHAGAIFYNDPSMLLDASATQDQILRRASIISHEVAHMWFGDLVTMRWFDDVWTKEVFANFMAAKIVNPSFPNVNHDLRFLLEHYPSAYDVDRTQGANPIRQPLANLNDAGTLYGNIIYDKAPIVMRQLERITGEIPFRDGLREYLKKFSYANATWPELISILDRKTPEHLASWSRTWVEERHRPNLKVTLTASGAQATISQSDPLSREAARGLSWPQRFTMVVGYADREERIDAYLKGASLTVKLPTAKPLYVLPNGTGLGYGFFELDDATRAYLLAHIEDIKTPLTRGSAWIDLWENFVEGRVSADAMLTATLRALPTETDEQNAALLLGHLDRLFWFYLPPNERAARAPQVETLLREGIAKKATASEKSAWFAAYRSVATSRDALAWVARIWAREEKIDGLPLAEPDEISLALTLAVKEAPGWKTLLDAQLARTQNPDRRERLAFLMPAVSDDPAVREAAFERLKKVENRAHEPWVLDSLRLLNHPLREEHARRFVAPSLDLLAEIQRTGDIFFPKRWVDAALGNHRSAEAAAAVRAYLARERSLPQRLRWFVEASVDDLLRVQRPSR